MSDSIRRQIADMNARIDRLAPGGTFRLVELPDGCQVEKPARDWWMHRREWKWIKTTRIDPNGWPPFVLYLAKCADESYNNAMANGGRYEYVETTIDANGRFKNTNKYVEAEYYKNERDEWLKKFFGEVLP